MNNVQIIGRLTKNPDVRYTQDQKAIARFSLAVNTGYGDSQRVDYPNIVVFGNQAENCEKYLAKGSKVALTGRVQTGSYTNKSGQKVYTTDIVANSVEFLDSKKQASEEQQDFSELNEDVPF